MEKLLGEPGSAFDTLPEHVLSLVAEHLSGGTLDNFRQTCSHFRRAANLKTRSLDFHEVCCSWEDASSAQQQLPACAAAALAEHPNVTKVTFPSSWRRAGIVQLLQQMADARPSHHSSSNNSTTSNSTSNNSSSSRLSQGCQLECLELHFQAVCPGLCQALANLAPGITQLQLSLDLAFELTTKQVRSVQMLAVLSLHHHHLQAALSSQCVVLHSSLSPRQHQPPDSTVKAVHTDHP
jgi:hypothetical protein